jgi:hypothetical protein
MMEEKKLFMIIKFKILILAQKDIDSVALLEILKIKLMICYIDDKR